MAFEQFEHGNLWRFQRRLADIAIGASVLRGHFTGALDTARDYVRPKDFSSGPSLNLRALAAARDEKSFLEQLDRNTESLQQLLVLSRGPVAPSSPPLWGSARKVLNVFLCEAYFNRVLHQSCPLQNVGPWLEVPLDKIISDFLTGEARRTGRPDVRFSGVSRLDSQTNR